MEFHTQFLILNLNWYVHIFMHTSPDDGMITKDNLCHVMRFQNIIDNLVMILDISLDIIHTQSPHLIQLIWS